jgi:hypothetical protein
LINENRQSFALAEFLKRPQADIKLARAADYSPGAWHVNPNEIEIVWYSLIARSA